MIYPLTLPFDSSQGTVRVIIERQSATEAGWRFASLYDERTFRACQTTERLSLRRQFAAQVALATTHPT